MDNAINFCFILFPPLLGKYRMTSDGWEEHFSVNYLSQSLMTLLLLPNLKLADGARVVNVSSKVMSTLHFCCFILKKTHATDA